MHDIYFNTSNVIFYRPDFVFLAAHFQISIHPMLFFILIELPRSFDTWHFNTSNVIFYLCLQSGQHQIKRFQYIQCYFLSLHNPSTFSRIKNFNTSNVIFYHIYFSGLLPAAFISIHPMLFFIMLELFIRSGVPLFQYIQCYFLSRRSCSRCYRIDRFQYIQCYFLSQSKAQVPWIMEISIHPMLFFIC